MECIFYSNDLLKTAKDINSFFIKYSSYPGSNKPPNFKVVDDLIKYQWPNTKDEFFITSVIYKFTNTYGGFAYVYNTEDHYSPVVLELSLIVDIYEIDPDADNDEYKYWIHNGKLVYVKADSLTQAVDFIKTGNYDLTMDYVDALGEVFLNTDYLKDVYDVMISLPLEVINMFYHHPWTIEVCLQEMLHFGEVHGLSDPNPVEGGIPVKLGVKNGYIYTPEHTNFLVQALTKLKHTLPSVPEVSKEVLLSKDISRTRFQKDLMTMGELQSIVEQKPDTIIEDELGEMLTSAFSGIVQADEHDDVSSDSSSEDTYYATRKRYNDDSDYTSD